MSSELSSARSGELPQHLVGLTVTTIFWCLLWGSFSPLSILGGAVVAVLVYVLFPLPPLARELVFRPWHVLVSAAVFAKDLAVSSAQVAGYALRPSGSPGSSVIAVQLRSRSDFFLTATAVLATLIPGSVVVEAQRSTGTLFLHVIGAVDQGGVDAMRESILAQEARLLRAFASKRVLTGAGVSLKRGGAQ